MAVGASEMNQFGNVNVCHFSSCDLFHKDGSGDVHFPGVRAVEMIDYLAGNFKTRFYYFRCHSTNIRLFENPFSVEVSDALGKPKLRLNCSMTQFCIAFSTRSFNYLLCFFTIISVLFVM
jgi:hypothetical protein